MIGGVQKKILLTQDENGDLQMTEEMINLLQGNPNASAKYKLVRERDSLTRYGREIGWIEWSDDRKFKKLHDKPGIGLSCMLDPHRMSFSWCTTEATEIIEKRENYIKFKTQNSIYELWKQEND